MTRGPWRWCYHYTITPLPLRLRQVHGHVAHVPVDHPLDTTGVSESANPRMNLEKPPCQMAYFYSGSKNCPHVLTFCRDAHITSQLLRISARYNRVPKSPESWLSNNIWFVGICKESIEI
jgi:hypothetical protein